VGHFPTAPPLVQKNFFLRGGRERGIRKHLLYTLLGTLLYALAHLAMSKSAQGSAGRGGGRGGGRGKSRNNTYGGNSNGKRSAPSAPQGLAQSMKDAGMLSYHDLEQKLPFDSIKELCSKAQAFLHEFEFGKLKYCALADTRTECSRQGFSKCTLNHLENGPHYEGLLSAYIGEDIPSPAYALYLLKQWRFINPNSRLPPFASLLDPRHYERDEYASRTLSSGGQGGGFADKGIRVYRERDRDRDRNREAKRQRPDQELRGSPSSSGPENKSRRPNDGDHHNPSSRNDGDHHNPSSRSSSNSSGGSSSHGMSWGQGGNALPGKEAPKGFTPSLPLAMTAEAATIQREQIMQERASLDQRLKALEASANNNVIREAIKDHAQTLLTFPFQHVPYTASQDHIVSFLSQINFPAEPCILGRSPLLGSFDILEACKDPTFRRNFCIILTSIKNRTIAGCNDIRDDQCSNVFCKRPVYQSSYTSTHDQGDLIDSALDLEITPGRLDMAVDACCTICFAAFYCSQTCRNADIYGTPVVKFDTQANGPHVARNLCHPHSSWMLQNWENKLVNSSAESLQKGLDAARILVAEAAAKDAVITSLTEQLRLSAIAQRRLQSDVDFERALFQEQTITTASTAGIFVELANSLLGKGGELAPIATKLESMNSKALADWHETYPCSVISQVTQLANWKPTVDIDQIPELGVSIDLVKDLNFVIFNPPLPRAHAKEAYLGGSPGGMAWRKKYIGRVNSRRGQSYATASHRLQSEEKQILIRATHHEGPPLDPSSSIDSAAASAGKMSVPSESSASTTPSSVPVPLKVEEGKQLASQGSPTPGDDPTSEGETAEVYDNPEDGDGESTTDEEETNDVSATPGEAPDDTMEEAVVYDHDDPNFDKGASDQAPPAV
jgi:hypothetical protein